MPDNHKYIELIDKDGNTYFISKDAMEFLQDLRDDDINEIRDVVETVQSVKRGGRFIRYAAITLFVTFTSFVAFGSSLIEAKKLLVRFFTGQ